MMLLYVTVDCSWPTIYTNSEYTRKFVTDVSAVLIGGIEEVCGGCYRWYVGGELISEEQDPVLVLERVESSLNGKNVTCEANNSVASSQQTLPPLSVQCTILYKCRSTSVEWDSFMHVQENKMMREGSADPHRHTIQPIYLYIGFV